MKNAVAHPTATAMAKMFIIRLYAIGGVGEAVASGTSHQTSKGKTSFFEAWKATACDSKEQLHIVALESPWKAVRAVGKI